MNDTVTEGEFSKYLESVTAYGGSPKVLMVRCTCPRPEDCACPEPDEEGRIDPCPACIAMVHTAPDCMIQVMTNWKPDKMKVAERELGAAVKSYCLEHGLGGKA